MVYVYHHVLVITTLLLVHGNVNHVLHIAQHVQILLHVTHAKLTVTSFYTQLYTTH